MEQKQAPVQSNGMVHAVIAGNVGSGLNAMFNNFVARVDDGRKFVLKGSRNAPESRDSLSFSRTPAPLAIGGHVLLNPDCVEYPPARDVERRQHFGRHQAHGKPVASNKMYPIATSWRRARPDEIPVASSSDTFKVQSPLADAVIPGVKRTTPFSESPELAKSIEHKLREALSAGSDAVLLYDPSVEARCPFLVFMKYDYDRFLEISGLLEDCGVVFAAADSRAGTNGCGYIDVLPLRNAADMARLSRVMKPIAVEGLAFHVGSRATIEDEVLRFCLDSAQI